MARFEAHRDGCAACREAVTRERALKRLLVENLVEVRAPRSFAITEAMLQQPAKRVPGAARTPVLAMRLAQVAVAASVIGFASLVVIDRGTGGSGSAIGTAAPTSAESDAGAAVPDGSSARDSGASKSAAPVAPSALAGGIQGAGAASPVARATDGAAGSYNSVPVQSPDGTRTAPGVGALPAASPGENAGTGWFRAAEGALALVIIAALTGYLVARRAHRRSFDV